MKAWILVLKSGERSDKKQIFHASKALTPPTAKTLREVTNQARLKMRPIPPTIEAK